MLWSGTGPRRSTSGESGDALNFPLGRAFTQERRCPGDVTSFLRIVRRGRRTEVQPPFCASIPQRLGQVVLTQAEGCGRAPTARGPATSINEFAHWPSPLNTPTIFCSEEKCSLLKACGRKPGIYIYLSSRT
nr:uncharacterized protein LOC112425185 isoform X1 [Macaca nemestrina]